MQMQLVKMRFSWSGWSHNPMRLVSLQKYIQKKTGTQGEHRVKMGAWVMNLQPKEHQRRQQKLETGGERFSGRFQREPQPASTLLSDLHPLELRQYTCVVLRPPGVCSLLRQVLGKEHSVPQTQSPRKVLFFPHCCLQVLPQGPQHCCYCLGAKLCLTFLRPCGL